MIENKQKNKSLVMITMILIILTTVFLSIGYYAWARYSSSMPGDATAQVAKWNFELRAGQNKDTEPTPFAITRTDGYGDVAEGILAPGTFGSIPVYVDMTGTEVLTKFELTFTITDCPRNIKFYASEADRTNNKPMKITQTRDENNKYVTTITVKKYYSIEDKNADDYVGKVHNETIYWKWAYETLDEKNSSIVGDEIDKEDSGKEAQIVITARATEVLEKGITLSKSSIKVGDRINYTKGETTVKGIVVNKTDDLVEFMLVDNNNKALLTEEKVKLGHNGADDTWSSSGEATSEAVDSYNRAIDILNGAAKRGYNEASRALTSDDVNRLVGYTPSTIDDEETYNASSSGAKKYIVDGLTIVQTTENETLNAIDIEGISVGTLVKIGNEYGGKTIRSITIRTLTVDGSTNKYYTYTDSGNYPLGTYFRDESIWLASHCVRPGSYVCTFGLLVCNSSKVDDFGLYYSDGDSRSNSYSVVPVVSLSSNIEVELDTQTGEWEVNQ